MDCRSRGWRELRRRGRFGTVLAIAASVVLVNGVYLVGRRPDVDVADLLPATMELPATYLARSPGSGEYLVSSLDWQEVRTTAELGAPCGPFASRAYRLWADGGLGGDPGVRLTVCRTPAPVYALIIHSARDSTDVAHPNDIPTYRVDPAPFVTLEGADDARIDCIWGSVAERCRSWILRARYGQYLVAMQYAAMGGGALPLEDFARIARQVDEHVSAVLASTVSIAE